MSLRQSVLAAELVLARLHPVVALPELPRSAAEAAVVVVWTCHPREQPARVGEVFVLDEKLLAYWELLALLQAASSLLPAAFGVLQRQRDLTSLAAARSVGWLQQRC